MGIKLLWYVSGPDGSVPWESHGSWTNSFEQFKAQVRNIDGQNWEANAYKVGHKSKKI
jgi:hypothetical protein